VRSKPRSKANFVRFLAAIHTKVPSSAYLEYDGNRHTIAPSKSFAPIQSQLCPHYHPNEAGEAMFDIRNLARTTTANTLPGRSWIERLLRKLCGLFGWHIDNRNGNSSPQSGLR
jgi:hypothetical protein